MGQDFYNFHVFAGDGDPESIRSRVLESLRFRADRQVSIGTDVLESAYADDPMPDIVIPGAVAVGPADRWIPVYDSWFGWSNDVPAVLLSSVCPVVVTVMSDSAAVHFYLYRNGECVDRFANRSSVFSLWDSDEERVAFAGRPQMWAELLRSSDHVDLLRSAWRTDGDASGILSLTAALFGWNADHCETGYTIDWDGIPEYYRAYLAGTDEGFDWSRLDGFTEFEPGITEREQMCAPSEGGWTAWSERTQGL